MSAVYVNIKSVGSSVPKKDIQTSCIEVSIIKHVSTNSKDYSFDNSLEDYIVSTEIEHSSLDNSYEKKTVGVENYMDNLEHDGREFMEEYLHKSREELNVEEENWIRERMRRFYRN